MFPPVDDSNDEPLVERVAEDILDRRRRGDRPTVEEYCAQYPDHAEELRAFLPTLLALVTAATLSTFWCPWSLDWVRAKAYTAHDRGDHEDPWWR